MRTEISTFPILLFLVLGNGVAQRPCQDGKRISGTVVDSTKAVIVGATVDLDQLVKVKTDSSGRFAFPCVHYGKHRLRTTSATFEPDERDLPTDSSTSTDQNIVVRLHPKEVASIVDVSGKSDITDNAAFSERTLSGTELANFADDPDDLQRQLQSLASAASGSPSAIVTIDGFQNNSRMPPKSSIAFIRLNPDLFAAEYAEPPYDGARVEVYTKAGQDAFHGALFLNTSDQFMNAKDPFATSRAAIGRQRYGFELSGPIYKKYADFNVNLEHRSINNFAVVNATVLDAAGNIEPENENSPTPQSLWIGSARVGWQPDSKNTASLSYIANLNQLENVGVGGTTLTEAGYSSSIGEYTVRATNVTTLSSNAMHETRVSVSWTHTDYSPNSTSPQLQVAGAFTSGGATNQAAQNHETAIEADDDLILTFGKHLLKAGIQLNDYVERIKSTQNYNGTYIFGGSSAPPLDTSGNQIPGSNISINGIEQYRRTIFSLPGGRPSAYQISQGFPAFSFNQLQSVVYIEDQWKILPSLKLSSGFRYAAQTAPSTFANFAPRLGVSWSPDKKAHWVVRGHIGLFQSPISVATYIDFLRQDGTKRLNRIVYSPNFGAPLSGMTPISTDRKLAPNLSQNPFTVTHGGIEHEFSKEWNAQANIYWIEGWNTLRTRNINSPTDGSPYGPRPIAPNLNILQFEQSGRIGGPILSVSMDHHSKHVQTFGAYIHNALRSDADSPFFTPQSASTNAGETARQQGQITHRIVAVGQVSLPEKIVLAGNLDLSSGKPFNILTGDDNNGDGVFNDRPKYAMAGDPNAVATRYGLLTAYDGVGVVPRNAGTMPWTVHLDLNVSKAFILDSRRKLHGARILAINIRSANILNHTNVTNVGNTLGSSIFGHPYTADNGRRLELGLRLSF